MTQVLRYTIATDSARTNIFACSTVNAVGAVVSNFDALGWTEPRAWELADTRPATDGELVSELARMQADAERAGCEAAEFVLRVDVELDWRGRSRQDLPARWQAACRVLGEVEIEAIAA